MTGQTHQSDSKLLGGRTLVQDHRCLAALLRPGFSVLDVGCGSGAITSGIAWRESNGWDNNMADHLPQLFEAAGLVEIETVVQDEIASRDSEAFADQIELWPRVVDNISEQLIASKFLNKSQLQVAKDSFSAWTQTELKTQLLAMKTVVGRVP